MVPDTGSLLTPVHCTVSSDELKALHKMKARIELIADIEDIHKLTQTLKELSKSS